MRRDALRAGGNAGLTLREKQIVADYKLSKSALIGLAETTRHTAARSPEEDSCEAQRPSTVHRDDAEPLCEPYHAPLVGKSCFRACLLRLTRKC